MEITIKAYNLLLILRQTFRNKLLKVLYLDKPIDIKSCTAIVLQDASVMQ